MADLTLSVQAAADAGLDWWLLEFPEHQGIQQLTRDLNRVYRSTPALWESDDSPHAFEWIDANDAGNNTFSWLRRDDAGGLLAVVANLSPVPRADYRIGLPVAGTWTPCG